MKALTIYVFAPLLFVVTIGIIQNSWDDREISSIQYENLYKRSESSCVAKKYLQKVVAIGPIAQRDFSEVNAYR